MKRAVFLGILALLGAFHESARGQDDLLGSRVQPVTALVREAIRFPDSPASWAGLAQELSRMETRTPGGADGIHNAVRIADSLAFSPGLDDGGSVVPAGSTRGASGGLFAGLKRTLGISSNATLFLLVLLTLGAASSIRRWTPRVLEMTETLLRPFLELVERVARVARGQTPPASVVAQERTEGEDSRRLALSLTEHGMPPNEVARRTGMAQDAVAVVLALSRGPGSFNAGEAGSRRRSA